MAFQEQPTAPWRELYPLPFYGPHSCSGCGEMIVKYDSTTGNGDEFDANKYALANPGHVYPNTQPEVPWQRHVCAGRPASSIPSATEIATADGLKRVDELQPGDQLLTADGAATVGISEPAPPPPRRTLHPLGDRIIVRRTAVKEVTDSGIIIPTDAREKPQDGVVLAVGPLATQSFKGGEAIMFGKYAGVEVEINEELLLIMRVEEIYAIVTEEVAQEVSA